MTIDEVKQLYDEYYDYGLTEFMELYHRTESLYRWWAPVLVSSILIFILAILIYRMKSNYRGKRVIKEILIPVIGSTGILTFLLLIGLFILTSYDVVKTNHTADDRWKAEVAYPYINNLPQEKGSIAYIEIDNTDNSEVNKTFVNMGFYDSDGHLQNVSDYALISNELPEIDEPYVLYHFLDEDLNWDLEKGYYNLEIYVPNDFDWEM
ncbi:hypothetical protein [Oceanobacillus oncorhynchi]|uniref:hypothetical protein n=1 Tax=Oceanobacillus oncorhynchi TaxID=545501 RepID=UPI001866523B|nr:hypothetical protein [Oceanobacillus oncorhynchi]